MQYTRDFSPQLHLITSDEYEKYSLLMPRLAPNTVSLASDGTVSYDIRLYDTASEQQEEINTDLEDDRYTNDEDDYEYDEDIDIPNENNYYDYYDDYDESNTYPDAVCEGIIVGHSNNREILSSKDGERLTIQGVDIVVLDHRYGLFALEEPQVSWANGETENYFDSYWENKCNELSGIYAQKLGLIKNELDIPDFDKTEYELTESDFNKGTAFNQIITGETGCGKTYKAINDEIDAGRRFAYIAPCRQLAYESYRYYADSAVDTLTSGEVKINPQAHGNLYGVFESVSPDMLKDFDTLIIDEGHFVNDPERGQELLSLIAKCREQDINIKILTATQTFQLNDFEQIKLPARYKVPEKKEIDFETARANIDKGMQTIWFCGSIKDTIAQAKKLESEGIKAIPMNSAMTPSERLNTQIAFENKEVQVVCATNVLAQGVNFECENLIIEYDPFETDAQQQQKIGRLGRPGTLKDKNEVYYTVESKRDKPKIPDAKTKIEQHERNKEYIEQQLNDALSSLYAGYDIEYNDIKYCIPEFQKWASEHTSPEDFMVLQLNPNESMISTFKKLLDIDLENINTIHAGCHESAMEECKAIFERIEKDKSAKPLNNLSETYLKNVLDTLISGDLSVQDIQSGTVSCNRQAHLSQTIPVIESLKDPFVRSCIQERINELEKVPGTYALDPDIADVNLLLQSISYTLDEIQNEQDALKNTILENMRKTPSLNLEEKHLEKEQLLKILQNPKDETYHVTSAETGVKVTKQFSDGTLQMDINPSMHAISVSFNGEHIDMRADTKEIKDTIGDRGYKLVMNVMDACREFQEYLNTQSLDISGKIEAPDNCTLIGKQAKEQMDNMYIRT